MCLTELSVLPFSDFQTLVFFTTNELSWRLIRKKQARLIQIIYIDQKTNGFLKVIGEKGQKLTKIVIALHSKIAYYHQLKSPNYGHVNKISWVNNALALKSLFLNGLEALHNLVPSKYSYKKTYMISIKGHTETLNCRFSNKPAHNELY